MVFQTASGKPANTSICKDWADLVGGESPLVLIDPIFKLQPFFSDVQSSSPVNLLIDDELTIVFKSSGVVPEDMPQTIATELAK